MSEATGIRAQLERCAWRGVLALLLSMLAWLAGAGSAVASGSGHQIARAASAVGVASAADGRAAIRGTPVVTRAEAAAEHPHRAAPVQDTSAEPGRAAPARPAWRGSRLQPVLRPAISLLAAGLPSGRAPPRSART
jgi:hypothetical protein